MNNLQNLPTSPLARPPWRFYIIDWNYDEDRSQIRPGHGPENVSRLRRFAVGLLKSKGVKSVAQKMRQLTMNVRAVLDYLRMTNNTRSLRGGAR